MYQKAGKGWLKHLDFMIIDVICLVLAYFIAYCIRQGFSNPLGSTLYRSMALILLSLEVIVIFFFETLKNVLKRGVYREFIITIKHDCLVIVLASFYLFVFQLGTEYSRIVLMLTGGLYFLLSYITRLSWKKVLRSKKTLERARRSLMIITTESYLDVVIDNIKHDSYSGFRVTGIAVVDHDMTGQEVGGVPIVASLSTALDYVCREWVDEVFVNLPASEPLCEELINQCLEMGVTVHLRLVKVTNLLGQKQLVERMGNYTVLTTSINIATVRQVFIKRAMDICGGIVGCILTGILYIFVAPSIYIHSPGPIFFSQRRVGKNGKVFKLYKFRSMYLDAEERKQELMAQNRVGDGRMFKLDYDPRIIGSEKGNGKGIGNFIRKFSIDEFPQFWNVLKGDMSLVGTRPPTLDEWEKYELHHRARLAIKPGVTGMWQVSGRSGITDFEEVVALDKKYITEWGFGMDFKILMKTILVVFGKDGAL